MGRNLSAVCYLVFHVFMHAAMGQSPSLRADPSGATSALRVYGNINLLNADFAPGELNYYRHFDLSKPSISNPEEWLSLYDRLRQAADSSLLKQMPDWRGISVEEEKANTEFNFIPIGIFDLKGVDENEIRFVDASVLQENLYQATATFKIGGRLFVSNCGDATGLEIDFGSGFQRYDLNEHQITHTFTATGRQIIKIKVLTNRTVYVFHTAVHVLQLQRRAAYRNYQISAPPVISDTTVYHVGNARIAATVPGANVRIVLGCDQVFDKPLLIIEGIDLGENRYLDVLEAEYLTVQSSLHAFAAQGFDIVFVDWQNSRDYIQNNAQVLKAVINDVNQSKIGNSPLIVVGESMGGLVGRWGLREMENEGVAHHVSHFICYDTPHQGANIPVGLTQIYWETPLDHFESHLVNFLPRFVFHYYQSLNTPAARQLLIHWGGRTNVGVGNTHSDYFTFRSELTAKGNGGYPAFCQNVALVEGSLTSSDRSLFDQFNYGDRILLRLAARSSKELTSRCAYE